MKHLRLLSKINRNYLLVSILLYVIAVVVFYFIINNVLNNDLNEELYNQEQRLRKLIETEGEIPSLYPLYEVHIIDTLMPASINDTSLFDPTESEMEEFRELNTYMEINRQKYHIVIRASSVDKGDFMTILLGIISGVLLLTMAGLYYLNQRINRHVWKPFYKNLQLIKSFSLNNDNKMKLEDSGIEEFRELNAAIVKLTDKVVSDYRVLKQFTENASHEMQTPLSILKVKLETLLNESKIPQSIVKTLAEIDHALSRLISLNKNLLELAKIENQQYTNIKTVDFNSLIQEVIHDYSELIQLKGLSLTTDLTAAVNFQMDPRLAEMLVSNLTGNAVKHCTEGGRIKIESLENKISFFNSGKEQIAEDHRIYERFYKEDPASRSTGLGLSIVQMICEIYHIKVSYEFVNKMHVFSLIF
ncbi:sensor histidine kinase [candidate division KSB1 bacterium]